LKTVTSSCPTLYNRQIDKILRAELSSKSQKLHNPMLEVEETTKMVCKNQNKGVKSFLKLLKCKTKKIKIK
jgi:hypothetical protein